jgi:hypothetical protein
MERYAVKTRWEKFVSLSKYEWIKKTRMLYRRIYEVRELKEKEKANKDETLLMVKNRGDAMRALVKPRGYIAKNHKPKIIWKDVAQVTESNQRADA